MNKQFHAKLSQRLIQFDNICVKPVILNLNKLLSTLPLIVHSESRAT